MKKIKWGIGFGLLLISSIAFADFGYYNNYQYLIGDRASGLGGAQTAAVNDSTALYYNPAGLGNVKATSFSISGNAYNYLQSTTKGYLEFERADGSGEYDQLDLKESDVSAVATTLVFSKKFDNFGTLAAGIFVPYQDNLYGSMKGETYGNGTYTYVESQFHMQSKYIVGMVGWGNTFFKKLKLGVSLFVGYYSGSSDDSEYFLDQWNDMADSSNETFKETYEFSDYLIGVTFGLQFNITKHNIIGVTFTTPGYSLYGTSETKTTEIAAGTDGASNDSSIESTKNDFMGKILSEKYSIGYAYSVPSRFSFTFDLELIGKSDAAPYSVVNFKTGVEYYLTRNIALRAGFFTDFSQQEYVDTDPYTENVEDIDYFGFSFSVSIGSDLYAAENKNTIQKKRAWTSVGLIYRWGIGDIRTASYNDNLDVSFRKKEMSVSSFSIFIGESIQF